MFIEPIQPIRGIDQLNEINKAAGESKDKLSFKSIFNNALNDYTESEAKVDEDIYKLSTGQSDDLHNLMINIEKSEASLNLVIQLRNKALDAYNEIMRMGV